MKSADFEPRVYYRLTDNWLELRLRLVVPDRGTRAVKDAMSREIFTAFDAAGIGIASATYGVVGLPPVRIRGAKDAEQAASVPVWRDGQKNNGVAKHVALRFRPAWSKVRAVRTVCAKRPRPRSGESGFDAIGQTDRCAAPGPRQCSSMIGKALGTFTHRSCKSLVRGQAGRSIPFDRFSATQSWRTFESKMRADVADSTNAK